MTKALIIVAHPDDETIWMGGFILKNKNWDWTVLSLCRKHDKDRSPKFKKVCDFYKAKSFMDNLNDTNKKPVNIERIKIKLTKQELKIKKEIITKMYGFQKNSFEEENCRDVETFMEVKL